MAKAKSGKYNSASLHLMMLPTVILVLIFAYLPMLGLVMAFQDFDFLKGIKAFWESDWVGLDNFTRIFAKGGDGQRILFNTINIAILKLILGVVVPVIYSILLNEISKETPKRIFQTIIYMPFFISWVIFGGIVKQMLLSDGTINVFIQNLGGKAIPFLTDNKYYVPTIIVTNVWKEFGFGTVIYLAAITNIDPALYEAAMVDGANRWKQTLHVTLPGMSPIIILLSVLAMQNVLNAGFDQIFNTYSAPVYKTGDILDTYIYRTTFESSGFPNYSLGAAVGFFKSVISSILIVTSYNLAYKLTGYRPF